MFFKAFHDPEYAVTRKLKREHVVQMHQEDLSEGKFWHADGTAKFDVNNPRTAEQMRQEEQS